MKTKLYITYAAGIPMAVLFFWGTVMAADFSFQPRLEIGVMQYAFESGPISVTLPSEPTDANTGFNFTQQSFEYSDQLLVIGGGGTLFWNHFFLDFSGHSAADGKDSATASFSAYQSESPATVFLSADPMYEANFDRMDFAVSLGYAFSGHFSVFAGYKKAKTEFDAIYQGPFMMVVHDEGSVPFDTVGGRLWGRANFNFEYEGPFVGAIQGWEFNQDYFIEGVLTASLALAYLDGEVEVEQRSMQMSITSIDGQEVPEMPSGGVNRGLINRLDTLGETLGYTVGIGWRGATAVESLSYSVNVSGYRYEFDSDDDAQSDINETAVVYKAGLSYAF